MTTEDVQRLMEAHGFRVTMASEHDGEVRGQFGVREVQLIHTGKFWWALAHVHGVRVAPQQRVGAFEDMRNRVRPLDAWLREQIREAA